jgi:hypothetical protein
MGGSNIKAPQVHLRQQKEQLDQLKGARQDTRTALAPTDKTGHLHHLKNSFAQGRRFNMNKKIFV